MSSPSACFSSSSRSMRSIKDFSGAPAIPPTSGIIPAPPVVMLPPQQGRDDSLRARLAQGREANLPNPIEVWGTGEAWTGRPCEGPRVQTCPAYRHRATSLLYPRTSPRACQGRHPRRGRNSRRVIPSLIRSAENSASCWKRICPLTSRIIRLPFAPRSGHHTRYAPLPVRGSVHLSRQFLEKLTESAIIKVALREDLSEAATGCGGLRLHPAVGEGCRRWRGTEV